MSHENKEYCQDSEYNRRLIKLTDNYLALFRIQMQEKLATFKAGAWNIAKSSKNPELIKICEEIDKIVIDNN